MSKKPKYQDKVIEEDKNKPIVWCIMKPVECKFNCYDNNCKAK